MLVVFNTHPETLLLMLLTGCSFVLALVLSITDDGKQQSQEAHTPHPRERPRRPLQALHLPNLPKRTFSQVSHPQALQRPQS